MLLSHARTLPPLAIVASAFASLALAAGCDGADEPEGPEGDRFDAKRAFADLERQVGFGPRPSGSAAGRRTAEFIAGSLRRSGLAGVAIQRPWRNVVARIPGRGAGSIVVGAHYDTKDGIPGFVGANDGASGVAVVLELARTLPNPAPGPTIQLVAFDAEEARGERPFAEDGLRGSRQYVERAREGGTEEVPALEAIRAMVLFDMVGDCELEIPREQLSDADLYEAFESAGSGAVFGGEAPGVSDDHLPFLEAGVPAVDLIDFTYGGDQPPGSFWHTPEDTLEEVCASSLDAVGEAAVRAIPQLP